MGDNNCKSAKAVGLNKQTETLHDNTTLQEWMHSKNTWKMWHDVKLLTLSKKRN